DINVYGVALDVANGPKNGVITLNANGTFSYVPNSGSNATSDSFGYCANGAAPTAANYAANLCTTVTLGAAAVEAQSGIVLNNSPFPANTASYVAIKPPGVLSVDKDNAGYPLAVVVASVMPSTGLTVTMDANGGFNASLGSPCATVGGCIATFTYQAQNS